MATKKKAKKTRAKKKAAAAPEKVVKKKATRSPAPEKEPKKTKTAKAKKTTATAKNGAARQRAWISGVIKTKDISPKGLSLITKVDALEVAIADTRDALEAKLTELQEVLGSPSFMHPDRGAMTIMRRNDKTFWRAKPAGKS